MSTRELDAAHLETIRDLANARDRDDASIDEITLRAALAETVAEIDRVHERQRQRAVGVERPTSWRPCCGSCKGERLIEFGFERPGPERGWRCADCSIVWDGTELGALERQTAGVDELLAEYVAAHPRALPSQTSVAALLDWNAERLRAAGVGAPGRSIATRAFARMEALFALVEARTPETRPGCTRADYYEPREPDDPVPDPPMPVELETAKRLGRFRRGRGADWLWVEPLPDGRALSLLPWGAGGFQLSIGRLGSGFHDDSWCYLAEMEAAAWLAVLTWNGSGEPEGWYRHPATGRRREGGDPRKETTR